MSDEHPSANGTPKDVLLMRLIDSNVAKNETEWMAARVISDLTEKNDNLQRSHARYEYVRRLSPRAFTELYRANIRGDGAFDDLVDQMIAKSD